MKDKLNREIKVNDYIAYSKAQGRTAYLIFITFVKSCQTVSRAIYLTRRPRMQVKQNFKSIFA